MAKGQLAAQTTYEQFGPQKGYEDPRHSVNTLAHGFNAVIQANEFKHMKIQGGVTENGGINITDKATGSLVDASVEHINGERYVHAMFHHVHAEEVILETRRFEFWHYRGGDVAREMLRILRGQIEKPEPIRGNDDMTTAEAAQFLGLTDSKVHSLRQDPYGPPWYRNGRRVYFPRKQLAEWKDSNPGA